MKTEIILYIIHFLRLIDRLFDISGKYISIIYLFFNKLKPLILYYMRSGDTNRHTRSGVLRNYTNYVYLVL